MYVLDNGAYKSRDIARLVKQYHECLISLADQYQKSNFENEINTCIGYCEIVIRFYGFDFVSLNESGNIAISIRYKQKTL